MVSEDDDDSGGEEPYLSSDPTDDDEDEDYNEVDDEEVRHINGDYDGVGNNGEVAGASSPSDEERKSCNVAALVRGNLVVRRQPLIPRVLSVSDGAAVARQPFKPPCSDGYEDQNKLARRLFARKRFVPWGASKPALVAIENILPSPSVKEDEAQELREPLPPGVEPLVLWRNEWMEGLEQIEVDASLVRFLRPHQREGVQFMFDCVSGLSSAEGICGCILADDMGLGKTLQSITLLYTLLRQGFHGKPIVKRALIVTPTSLVSNWESEINKWIGRKIQLLSLCETSRADVLSGIDSFLRPCSPFQALAALSCTRRILLSGTPMQNDLEEFFAMVNFTNPGILGDVAYFRRYYETPIISGREPMATMEERRLGLERSAELSAKVNQIVEVVCCKLTPLQLQLYKHFIQSKNIKHVISEELKQSKILAYITALKKLCNHPKLIYDTIKGGVSGTSGFEDCMQFFPPELFSGRSGSWTGGGGVWVELSGKMHVLARLLCHLRSRTDDRIVLVSNYTQTLDLFAQLCRERRYPYVRLDGTTSIGKRQKLVNRFNDPTKDEFVFLLSSKAGGCGLNLIGGNRLVLFDPDWNPANDKQVYQRQMSKEGLQKVIQQELGDSEMMNGNFLSAENLRDLFTLHEEVESEIHENIGCARCKADDQVAEDNTGFTEVDNANYLTNGNAQENQSFNDIGGFAEIAGCLHRLKSSYIFLSDRRLQIGCPLEEDLQDWGHHCIHTTVPDAILQASAGEEVTFVFTNQIDGKLVPVESTIKSATNHVHNQDKIVKEVKRPRSFHSVKLVHAISNEKKTKDSPRH
ncbi:DNA repair and recombination protein RAD54 [Apostasia shenzhenica]|uniref:DNA repair and recombination protein RAD54 n=1 Tax=Apostasia shenzhenica TaxID=1088818 RepID=A0A2I0AKX1_9ASPA|nr:DNA repair and recombination protein RAD54 [Apostasia shenzhenica]